jgi:hypothetical protein
MKNFQIECPINPLSLGQVSFGVLHEIFRRGHNPVIWPTGEVDISVFNYDEGFPQWLKYNIERNLNTFDRQDPCLQIWHINGTHKKVAEKNVLWTVSETSDITDTEKNLLSANNKVLVTSKYSQFIFQQNGIDAEYCPNFFDARHFHETGRVYKSQEDVVQWGLFGKIEKRKATLEIMRAWTELFGGNKNHRLNCCINNPFIESEHQIKMVESAFGGKIPFNVNLLGFQTKNSLFNDVLNFIDIDLSGLSCAEGFGLPHFTCGALNKVCVSLNAHAHKDYNEGDNFVKVEPSGMQEIYDGHFFQKGAAFNQGEMSKWEPSAAKEGMKKALDLLESGVIFKSDLKEKFSVEKTVDILLGSLDNL